MRKKKLGAFLALFQNFRCDHIKGYKRYKKILSPHIEMRKADAKIIIFKN